MRPEKREVHSEHYDAYAEFDHACEREDRWRDQAEHLYDRCQHMREIIEELSDKEHSLEVRVRRTDDRRDALAKASIQMLVAIDAGRLPTAEQVKAVRELCS